MGKNPPTSLAGISIAAKKPLFQNKGEAAPTTPAVGAALIQERGGAQASEVAVANAVPEPAAEPAVTVEKAASVVKSIPRPKAEKPKKAETAPEIEVTGPLISTTVKLDPKRHMEIKLQTVLTKKSFQDIAVEALDLWLERCRNQE